MVLELSISSWGGGVLPHLVKEGLPSNPCLLEKKQQLLYRRSLFN